jgi:hypothetical protein
LLSFLEGLGGYLSLGCPKLIQDEISLSLVVLQPVKTAKKKTPKAAKKGVRTTKKNYPKTSKKTELETREYELTKSKLYCRNFMTVGTAR